MTLYFKNLCLLLQSAAQSFLEVDRNIHYKWIATSSPVFPVSRGEIGGINLAQGTQEVGDKAGARCQVFRPSSLTHAFS